MEILVKFFNKTIIPHLMNEIRDLQKEYSCDTGITLHVQN